MRATPLQRRCHVRSRVSVRFVFKNWSGARDLNPGPHGPEIYAVLSTEDDFDGFELISGTPGMIPGGLHTPKPHELLHELLHGAGQSRPPRLSPGHVTKK